MRLTDPFCWAADILANHSNGEIFAWGGDGKDWYKDGEHDDQWCRDQTLPPSYALQAHTAPLGLVFYDGRGRYAFPPEYYNQLFVAEHGSWNSQVPRGYKVVRIGTDEHGEALASTSRDFFAFKGPGAWWTTAANSSGPIRPVEVRVGPEGEMYVSSDNSGQIIVIRHFNDRHTPVLTPQLVSAGYNYSTPGGPTKASAEFSFDMPRTQGSYRWLPGQYPRQGVAQFDGASLHVNMTAADNNAGATAPNITGGNSTYEMWINVDALPSGGSNYIVMELLEPGMTTDGDDYIRIMAAVSEDGAIALVWAMAKQAGQSEVALSAAVQFPTGEWHHISLLLIAGFSAMCLDGCKTASVPVQSSVPLISRRAALLGHSHRFTQNGVLTNFSGYLDDVRLYSYALSPLQLGLNYLLSADDRTNPVLQANLHMQPPENSEARFQHRGPSNHYGPQPSADLFPGWIRLNGSQYINLTNPMSGVGHVWRGDVFTAQRGVTKSPAMSLEFWFRLDDGSFTYSTTTLLSASPVVSLWWGGAQLYMLVGSEEFYVPWDPLKIPRGWTHLVLTASPEVGGNSYYTAYVNGTSAGYHGGGAFKPQPIDSDVTLGGASNYGMDVGLMGDLAIFRVYDFALNATQIKLLFETQVDEGRRMRQEVPLLDLDHDGVDDTKKSVAALVIGSLVAVAVVAAIVFGLWRLHQSRKQTMSRRVPSEGYSAELMSDAH